MVGKLQTRLGRYTFYRDNMQDESLKNEKKSYFFRHISVSDISMIYLYSGPIKSHAQSVYRHVCLCVTVVGAGQSSSLEPCV